MAKIKRPEDYRSDNIQSESDAYLGSDFGNSYQTKNYVLNAIKEYVWEYIKEKLNVGQNNKCRVVNIAASNLTEAVSLLNTQGLNVSKQEIVIINLTS